MDSTATPAPTGIAAELASAGFEDAREIGRGGSGVVYRCHQTALRRSIAIKVLASDVDEDSRERFLREGYAMGGLSGHPNIVNILQVGVTESNRPYIVMPYCTADDLGHRLQRVGPIQWPDALRMGVKLCAALETAHRAGTLHRDIKPGNVLVDDYGEPQLSDFGIAHIDGGYETATGFYTGTIAYSAPEVLAGNSGTVAADIYSLGATLYAVIAGTAAHERNKGEDLIAQYRRITSASIPDLRPGGVPDDVCTAIEKAMSLDPAKRQASAAEFGRELQAAQRHNGLVSDPMALSGSGETSGTIGMPPTPVAEPAIVSEPPQQPPLEPPLEPPQEPPLEPPQEPPERGSQLPNRWNRTRVLVVAGAAVVALLLVLGGVYFLIPRDSSDGTVSATEPAEDAQPAWQPITNARVARAAVAATQADGTIWIFGGIGADGVVSARHEGYDPPIDAWKGGADLPVPVRHAMAVTWQGTPVVLGGWTSSGGAGLKVATDQVWRVVNGRWVELPPLLAPRAAAAAAVVGDRIVVIGGVNANGALLNTTEIFDGNSWTLGAELPTPRQRLAAASDGKLVYAVGGTDGTSEVRSVEAYDPVANTWKTLPDLPQARGDLGVAIADGRLLAVGGMSAGQVLNSVAALDLLTLKWVGLPDMGTARQGMAVAAVANSVYAIGGSTGVGDREVTSSAEALKPAARKTQPVSQWRTLPDAPTPRLMTAWTVLDGKVWIAGGLGQGTALRTVASFDPATGTWQEAPQLPIPLHHATAATYRGEVVVIGGTTDDLAQASEAVFALRGGEWVELPSLTHPRAGAGAAVVGDNLVVVGGQNDKQLVPQTEVFDGESWEDAADLPIPREHLAAVSDGDYVYAVGGRFLSSDRNSAAFERFDPESGTWTEMPDMPTPRGSYGATFIDGRIVAVGGEDPTRVLAEAAMFDIAGGTWTELPPLPTPRHAEVVAAVGDTVYSIGGADRPTHVGAVATVEALDFR